MNTTASSPSGRLAQSLAAVDPRTLRAQLQGLQLPALGGGTEPAEIILRALEKAPNRQELAAGLAPVLARVIEESIAELEEGLTPAARFVLRQALWLAADLPPDSAVASSIRHLASELEARVPDFWLQDPLAPAAVRALVYQQTDAQAEPLWLRLLESVSGVPSWTPQQRTILLSAWRGLLFVPPHPDDERDGRIVEMNLPRIARGLSTLKAGVKSREDGPLLVGQAVNILTKAFPRSPQFWIEMLNPLIANWPTALREEVTRRLPKVASLSAVEAKEPRIFQQPEGEAAALQAALSESRSTIEVLRHSLAEKTTEIDRLRQENERLRQKVQRKLKTKFRSMRDSGRIALLGENIRP